MVSRRAALIVAGCLLVLAGCASGKRAERRPVPLPYDTASTVYSSGGEGHLERAEQVYGEQLDVGAARERLADALAREPENSALHEMAAYLASVDGDDDARFHHMMRAAADVSSPLTALYLWELDRRDMTAAERERFIDLLARVSREHYDASTRSYARASRARVLKVAGRFEESDEELRVLGFVDRWQLIGPLNGGDEPLSAVLPPEKAVDLEQTLPGQTVDVSWREITRMDRRGLLPVESYISWPRRSVAYAFTSVISPVEGAAELRLTASGPLKVWLNGALVIDEPDPGRRSLDNVAAKVHLSRGANRLLVKSVSTSDWRFGVRFTAPGGERLAEPLSWEATVEPLPSNPVTHSTRFEPAGVSLETVAHEGRAAFLAARVADRLSDSEEERRHYGAFFEDRSSSPLALYWAFGSLGDFPSEEHLPMLEEAIDAAPDRCAGLLYLRAGYLRGRKRYHDALVDLRRAIARQPHARFARMRLSKYLDSENWEVERCALAEETARTWGSGWAWWHVGDCREERGLPLKAAEAYENARALRPGAGNDVVQLRQLASERGDHAAALRYARGRSEAYPYVASYRIDVGEELVRLGRLDEAEAIFEGVRQQRPTWDVPYLKLAEVAQLRGELETAVELWREALRRDDSEDVRDRVAYAEAVLRGDAGEAQQTGARILAGGDLIDRRGTDLEVDLAPLTELIPGEEHIARAVTAGAEIEKLPGAHVAYLLDDELTVLGQGGKGKRLVTLATMALDTDGRDDIIRASLPKKAKVEVLRAYTRTADGARLDAKSLRRGVVRFKKVEVGAVTVVQYLVHTEPRDLIGDHFIRSWTFQGTDDQRHGARWVIAVPDVKDFNFTKVGPIDHRTEKKAGHTLHFFISDSQPPLRAEPHVLGPYEYQSHAYVSTIPDWDTYVEWEMDRLDGVFVADEELRAKTREIVGDATGPEAFERILAWVEKNVRYQQDYENTMARIKPHPASQVLDRGYGDCKDKAVLLIQMADEVGIALEYVLLRSRPNGRIPWDVPGLWFNHAIAYVPPQDGFEDGLFVDPTTDGLDLGNLRPDDQGADALVIDPKEGDHRIVRIPFRPPEQEYEKHRVRVSVEPDGSARVDWEMEIRGSGAQTLRQIARNETRERVFYQTVFAQLINGKEVTSYESKNVDTTEERLVLSFSGEAENLLSETEDGRRLNLPLLQGLFTNPLARYVALPTRRFPLEMVVPRQVELDLRVELPEDHTVSFVPEAHRTEHSCFEALREIHRSGRELRFEVVQSRACAEVSPEDYVEFRSVVQAFHRSLGEAVEISSR